MILFEESAERRQTCGLERWSPMGITRKSGNSLAAMGAALLLLVQHA